MNAPSLIVIACALVGACSGPSTSPNYRVDIVAFEVPAAELGSFDVNAPFAQTSMGFTIDESGAFERDHPHARRIDEPAFELAPGARRSWQLSPALTAEFSPAPGEGWAIAELESTFTWHAPDGALLGNYASTTPVPEGHWMKLFCVPSQASAQEVPALVTFFKLHPPTGWKPAPGATPHCQACAAEKK